MMFNFDLSFDTPQSAARLLKATYCSAMYCGDRYSTLRFALRLQCLALCAGESVGKEVQDFVGECATSARSPTGQTTVTDDTTYLWLRTPAGFVGGSWCDGWWEKALRGT